MTISSRPARRFRFFGAERSYFSGKVRPALRAKRVDFDEILPTPKVMREIRERTGLLFLPTVDHDARRRPHRFHGVRQMRFHSS
jgi:hypothetical protein